MATEQDVWRISTALPGVTEGTWYGTPGYKVAGKGFLRLRTEAEGALVVLVADEGEKAALINDEPATFFTTPHYDGRSVVLVNLDTVQVDELEELITESWRKKAPAKLVAELDRRFSDS